MDSTAAADIPAAVDTLAEAAHAAVDFPGGMAASVVVSAADL
jgi:hypothetical protein